PDPPADPALFRAARADRHAGPGGDLGERQRLGHARVHAGDGGAGVEHELHRPLAVEVHGYEEGGAVRPREPERDGAGIRVRGQRVGAGKDVAPAGVAPDREQQRYERAREAVHAGSGPGATSTPSRPGSGGQHPDPAGHAATGRSASCTRSGSHSVNVLPRPTSLSTVISPPSARAIRRLIASPIPAPRLSPPVLRRANSSKRSGCWSAGIPGPVSRTWIAMQGPGTGASPSARRSTRTITPPRSVNLTAFESRLLATWRIRAESDTMGGRSAGA